MKLPIAWWRHRSDQDDGRIGFFDTEFRSVLIVRIKSYMELMLISTCMLWIALSLFYGATHKRGEMANNINIYVIDLDGGSVGGNVTRTLMDLEHVPTSPTWRNNIQMHSVEEAEQWVLDNGWGALIVNPGASQRLADALTTGADYNPDDALTMVQSTGRMIIAEMLFVQSALTNGATLACQRYAMRQIFTAKQHLNSNTNFQALVNPLGFRIVDVAPEGFPLAPVLVVFGFLSCLLCLVGMMIMWKMTSFGFFSQVKFRDVCLMWLVIIPCAALLMSLYFSFAFLAFKGPSYNTVTNPYKPAMFFKVWFTTAGVITCTSYWLFAWFLNLPPKVLAFPSVCTVIPNVLSTIAVFELAPKFFRFLYATPFFNGYRIIHYTISGAHPRLGRNAGLIVAEIVVMAIALCVSIWFRQSLALRGICDMSGFYRGSPYFHSTIPYYKDISSETIAESSTSTMQTMTEHRKPINTNDHRQTTSQHSADSSNVSTSSGGIMIRDFDKNNVDLTSGNLGV